MATKSQAAPGRQLHVKLTVSDERKLSKLARAANLSISDAIRTMIRSTSAIQGAQVKES